MTEPLVHEFTVACAPEHAFAVWAERTSLWWPASHSVSGAPEAITFEPCAGGRIFERAPGGDEHDWGRVLTWEPPRRLAYSWHLRQDSADATEVEITFAAAGEGTAVVIVHRGWERLGARGTALRERNVRGWAGLLPAYAAVVRGEVRGARRGSRRLERQAPRGRVPRSTRSPFPGALRRCAPQAARTSMWS